MKNKVIILREFLEEGIPGPEHFEIDECDFDYERAKSEIGQGGMILKTMAILVDPYMRSGMKRNGSAISQMHPGEPLLGYVAGKVLASNHPAWKVNDYFGGRLPFQLYHVLNASKVDGAEIWKLTDFVSEETISYGVSILGMPGITAIGSVHEILQVQPGEVLFVSSAAGVVGSLVGMLAKNVYGCSKVIGSCGGEAKNRFITEHYGFDAALDYKKYHTKEEMVQVLQELAPQGIDMYHDNVGGIHFEAALEVLRPHGRIGLCGQISEYNLAEPLYVPIKPWQMIYQQQRIEGFLFARFSFQDYLPKMAGYLQEGKVKIYETKMEGIEAWPEAFQSLFTGSKMGKIVVMV